MEDVKKNCITWIKGHKKELLIAGVSASAIILVILGLKNQKALEEARQALEKLAETVPEEISTLEIPLEHNIIPAVDKIPITRTPHDVSFHRRNLPEGRNASPEKLAQAAARGIVLAPGQTFVEAYRTGGVAA